MPNFILTKRTIYISLSIILLGVLIFVAFRLLAPAQPQSPRPTGERPGVISRIFGLPAVPEEEGPPAPGEGAPERQISGAPEERLVQLTDFSVVSPVLDSAGKRVLTYKKSGGALTAVNFETLEQEKISTITIVGILEAFWSPRGDRAAVFYLDGETLKSFLHIGTSSVAVLPQNIHSFSWSPTGNSLAYLIRQDERLNLVTANSSGGNASTEFRTPILDAQIMWVTADKIAFQTAPSGLAHGFLFAFSRSRGSFEKILGPLAGLTAKWSPDGSRLLGASAINLSGKNISLAVYDASGKELFRPGLSTLPQKCVFAGSDAIYCAVPRFTDAGWILPDDYLRGEANTSDRIFMIDLKNKSVREVMNEGNFDMSELVLSQDKKTLFFVNRIDGTLWMYQLE